MPARPSSELTTSGQKVQGVRPLQTFPVQRGRLRDITGQVPDRGESGLHVPHPPFAARRLKERDRLLVLRGRPRKLPLGQSEVSDGKNGTTPPRVRNGNAPGSLSRSPAKDVPRLGEQLLCPRKLPAAVGQEGGVGQGFANQRSDRPALVPAPILPR